MHNGQALRDKHGISDGSRSHQEGEKVVPMVGPVGIHGSWLATGHDELAKGLVSDERDEIGGAARSADWEMLDQITRGIS